MTSAKRAIDVIVAGVALLALLPVLALLAVAVWFQDRSPILFRQERIGRGGKPFILLKIRSMRTGSEKRGPLVTSARDERVTSLGRWLRKRKLDELPQFWNVLKGDMSLVGPRPEVARYVNLYSPEQRRVLELTPGLTDPATIAFRDEEDLIAGAADPERYYVEVVMPMKIQMNLEYAEVANVRKDFGVLFKTVRTIL